MTVFQRARAAMLAGDLERAADLFIASLSDEPVHAAQNLGQVYRSLGLYEAAEHYFRQVLKIIPDWPYAAYPLSVLLLAQGHYAEGWRLYEGRRGVKEANVFDPPTTWPSLECPEWRGEPIRGKRVLVFGEQGFGDQIMFARFLRTLRELGAETAYMVWPEVAPLYPGSCSLKSRPPEADFWCLAGSLPYRLGATIYNLPAPLVSHGPLSSGGGVGVVPTGRPSHGNDANRSLYAEASRLLALGLDLRPEATSARDFAETAQIIAGLDLVITVDTSVAHLAASMGKPTWILLPARGTDWRWMRERDDSPWYPTARLFRQTRPGDWSSVLTRVRLALDEFAGDEGPVAVT